MTDKPSMLSSMDTGTGTASAMIRTDMIDKHNRTMSIPSLWEKSYLCPCRNRETRQPDPSCELCHGRGIAFLSPKRLSLIIQSQDKGVFNGDLGLIDSGTAIGTPDRDTRIAFRDRITIPLAQVSQSFIFDVSESRVENGFYMVYDVHEIELATTMDGELSEGEDYTFDQEKNLFFPKEKLIGKNVSINILTTLRYLVADLLKEHRYAQQRDGSFERLPQKLLLKREDIFIDKEAFSSDVVRIIDTKQERSDNLNGFFTGSGN